MRILFVAPRAMGTGEATRTLTTFHESDVRVLREIGHDVRILPWRGHPYPELVRMAVRSDLVFCWTIGDHAAVALALAKALRIPFVCVIGGYEFADVPIVNYGNLITARGQILSGFVYAEADALLYVDPSLILEAATTFGASDRNHYVPTGYDTDFWTPGESDREDLVVTVAHAPGWDRFYLKGLDRFVAAAASLPDYEFHIVGEVPQKAYEMANANVVFDGWIGRDNVRALYRRAKAYCQLSVREGLPNAVCEAMLCGCVPVGTPVNGILTAVGDAGFYARNRDETIRSIEAATRAPAGLRVRARERITSMFPIGRRREELRGILERVA